MIDDRLYVFIFNDKVDRIQPKNGGKDGWPQFANISMKFYYQIVELKLIIKVLVNN